METFPLQGRQDSKFFSISQTDVAIVGKLEGGYEKTRPRTTRKPRRIFKTGFTHLTQVEQETLQAFYETVGKFEIFQWSHPLTNEVIECRITDWPAAKYAGVGGYHVFDWAGITIKEA